MTFAVGRISKCTLKLKLLVFLFCSPEVGLSYHVKCADRSAPSPNLRVSENRPIVIFETRVETLLRIPRRIAFLSIYKSGHHGVRTGSSAQLSGWSIADPADAPSGLRIMWGGSVKQAHVARGRRARGRHHALPQPQDRARAHAALRRGTFGAADDRGAVRVRRYYGTTAAWRGGQGAGGGGGQPRRRLHDPR